MQSTHSTCATGRTIKMPQPTHCSNGFSPESSHALLQPARSHQCMSYGQTSIVSPCFEPVHSGYGAKGLAIGRRLVLASAHRSADVGAGLTEGTSYKKLGLRPTKSPCG